MTGKDYLPPRGMRDLAGFDAELHEYLVSEFKRIAVLNGFKPVIPPTIEFFKLFEAKSGEEIKKTMYVFEDKAGRLVALRPEVTASVVRIYLRLLRGEIKPVRLYYVSQCFRYEEPQKGRYREFWQGGLEIFGDPSLNADLAVALTASRFLDEISIKHCYVVSNVAVHRAIMKKYDVPSDIQDHILHLIDKSQIDEAISVLEKQSSEAVDLMKRLLVLPLDKLLEFVEEIGLSEEEYSKIINETKRIIGFIEGLKELGYKAIYDPTLVRGLAYYTGLIYEYKVEDVEFNPSIGGGGRYDGLTTVYDGPFEYSTGLALGLDRIALILKDKGQVKTPVIVNTVIIVLEKVPLIAGYKILSRLISIGVSGWVLRAKKIGKALSTASRKNVDYAIIIGKREYESGKVAVKDMNTGEQIVVDIDSLEKTLVEKILSKR